MLAEQRRWEIVALTNQQGSVSTFELSRKFGVSEMTIRRDLRALETAGSLRQTHGGAIAIRGSAPQEQSFTVKSELQHEVKTAIALYAAQRFVADHDVIVLDPGSTALEMVRGLKEKQGLVVVANGLFTLQALSTLVPQATVISTGGILRETSFTFVGPTAERFFEGFFAQTLFLSAVGFSLETGLTDPQMIDTEVKKAMIRSARRVVVLLDSSKFGVHSMNQVLGAFDFPVLVTDQGAPAAVLQQLRDRGVEVHVV
jgi:DeoR/GlpR family transcriptional regulator of sugar metabolism